MIRTLVVLGLAALLLVGCSGGKPSAPDLAGKSGKSGKSDLSDLSDPSDKSDKSNLSDKSGKSDRSATADTADPHRVPEPTPAAPNPAPNKFQIPKTGTKGWVASRVAAPELGARIGKAVRSLKAVYGETVATIKTPVGNGQVTSRIKIQDSKVFSIQFMKVGQMPETLEVRSNGKLHSVSSPEGAFKSKSTLAQPLPESKLSPAEIARRWPVEFPRLVFAGLTAGNDPWKPLVEQLVSGRAGFKSELNEREVPFRGKTVRNFRLIARRTPAAAKKLGRCEVEMVFDGQRYLPVTIRVNFTDPKEGVYQILWQAGWSFARKFKPQEFEL